MPQLVGSWHWLSSTEVHFRPQVWPAGTQVDVNLDLNGVKAADDLWGGRAYSYAFTVGKAQVATVDAAAHTFVLRVDGASVGTWATSLGRPEFATRNGTYVVQSKDETRQMTSCNADITCDKSSPEYYDLEVDWSVRLTWSGTFVHSAPWSEGSQGSDNVSHGCLNLSDANGRTYFQLAQYGDVVTVARLPRGVRMTSSTAAIRAWSTGTWRGRPTWPDRRWASSSHRATRLIATVRIVLCVIRSRPRLRPILVRRAGRPASAALAQLARATHS